MSYKALTNPYKIPIILYWKVIAGNKNIHPLNLQDIILDDYDLKIRKIDVETRDFIKYVH